MQTFISSSENSSKKKKAQIKKTIFQKLCLHKHLVKADKPQFSMYNGTRAHVICAKSIKNIAGGGGVGSELRNMENDKLFKAFFLMTMSSWIDYVLCHPSKIHTQYCIHFELVLGSVHLQFTFSIGGFHLSSLYIEDCNNLGVFFLFALEYPKMETKIHNQSLPILFFLLEEKIQFWEKSINFKLLPFGGGCCLLSFAFCPTKRRQYNIINWIEFTLETQTCSKFIFECLSSDKCE